MFPRIPWASETHTWASIFTGFYFLVILEPGINARASIVCRRQGANSEHTPAKFASPFIFLQQAALELYEGAVRRFAVAVSINPVPDLPT